MSTMTVDRGVSGAARPGFGDVLASEWTKLRTVRSTYIEIILTLCLTVGMTALICLAIGPTFDQLSAEQQAQFDPVFTSFFGWAFGGIVLVVLAVTFVSSEYTSGMIRLTFTATPRRGQVLWAKVLIITVVTLLLGFIATFASFFVGQAVLGAHDIPTASLSDPDALRAALAASLTTPVWPLLGAAVAALLRSTASALTTILGFMFIPGILGGLLPQDWQENVLRYLPGNAQDSLLMTNPAPGSLQLEVLPALGVIAVWLVAAYACAYIALIKRDV